MLRIRSRPSLPPCGASPVQRRRILLVDPDPASRDIGGLLLRYLGYEVQAAATAREALHLAREARPAAVVSELMGDVAEDGTIVEALARHPDTAAIPVLVLTTHVLPEDRERALSAGAARFLAKPCDGQRLRDALAEVVGDPHAARAAVSRSRPE